MFFTLCPFSLSQGQRMASVDGDVDRLVYWYLDSVDGTFHLLDGDAIAVLAGKFIYEQLACLNLQSTFKVGVVQTAYANGAATHYLKKQGVPLAMARTVGSLPGLPLCNWLSLQV